MGHLLPVYKRSDRGRVSHIIVDSESIPDGWVDSPDKVPGNEPVRADTTTTVSPEPKPAPIYGEPATAKRGPGRSRTRY